jgi:hypothetical protein
MYGLTAKGFNEKRVFDIKMNTNVSLKGGYLSNPIMAG